MDVKQIERLMAAMEAHGVTEFAWSEGEQKLTLSRETRRQETVSRSTEPSQPSVESVRETPEAPANPGGKEVLSPMVGTYHPAPKPVKVGAKLKKGEVLCVIEAMKLMNDIVMDEDGEIVFLALGDGGMVEFGQVLAVYKPL